MSLEDDESDFGHSVKVLKIDDFKVIGEYENENIVLKDGKFGKYLQYSGGNYSLPAWARDDDQNGKLTLIKCQKIIDYKRELKKKEHEKK